MDLSIIIVNHNAKKYLRDCLDSLLRFLKESRLEYEILVVDNDSKDGSQEMMEKEYSKVRFIETNADLGWAGGNNRGIRISKGRYLLLLNSDILILENSSDTMVEFMEKNPNVGMLGPKLLDEDGGVWTTTGRTPGPFMVFLRFCLPRFLFSPSIKKVFVRSSLRKYGGKNINEYFSITLKSQPSEVEIIGGASLLIRRRVLDEIGLLDENFFSYSDDTDLSVRTRKAGWKIVYFPETKMVHYGGKSTGGEHKLPSFCDRAQSAYYYFQKHYNKRTIILVKFLLLFALVMKFPQMIYHSYIKGRKKNLMRLYLATFRKIVTGNIV